MPPLGIPETVVKEKVYLQSISSLLFLSYTRAILENFDGVAVKNSEYL